MSRSLSAVGDPPPARPSRLPCLGGLTKAWWTAEGSSEVRGTLAVGTGAEQQLHTGRTHILGLRVGLGLGGAAVLMAAASATPPGSLDLLQPGFSTTLLGTKLEDKYLCSACRNVLRRPFQAQCGHRYCSFCLSSILR
ncbi:hypothetical protein J1605_017297 [Eschrichtius robustus]|uniref:Zinc finger C3HC4 RING-type domain-containing protein n=1 Tax=Eschrichtius robustus TaxID=9764 RepID=A0AB34I2K4_ESCRO|nr:hypothetical protein J1605_017297 [Eschrichtius robustus]